MASEKHTHQYHQQKLGNKTIFKCILPGCTHYLYKELVENVLSVCNVCEMPFLMTKAAMTLAYPHCKACTKPRVNQDKIDKIRELLELHK